MIGTEVLFNVKIIKEQTHSDEWERKTGII